MKLIKILLTILLGITMIGELQTAYARIATVTTRATFIVLGGPEHRAVDQDKTRSIQPEERPVMMTTADKRLTPYGEQMILTTTCIL